MNFYVYILFSESRQKYYAGQTNNMEDRLLRHNSGQTISTKHGIHGNEYILSPFPHVLKQYKWNLKLKREVSKDIWIT